MNLYHCTSLEVTPINRQTYMAEVENLLGLITDEATRTKLLAQMEQMFDAAEDEGKLIEQIGSPTKVAVALIRYADKKRAGESPKAEAVPVPEAPVTELISEAEANAAAPEESSMPELAYAPEEAVEVVEAPEFIEAPAVELPEEDAAVPERLEDLMAESSGFVAEELLSEEPAAAAEPAEAFVEAAGEAFEEAEAAQPAMDEALVKAVTAEAEEAFGDYPAQEEAPAQETAAENELVEELFGQGEEEAPAEEEPEKEYVKIGWKAFLYFLIPGLVPGLPVFLVLFALSLVFLAVGVAAVGFAVGVFMSAFVGFNVVADMLLLIGAGASIFAIAMVLMWFAIWFLTQVCFGWVRLIRRGGIRFSRKEVQAA